MIYSCSVDIHQPREKVIQLFDNPDNWPHWQIGLLSVEHLTRDPRAEKARSRLQFKINGREIEMIETVEKRNLPDEFVATYEARGVFNRVRNLFAPIDDTSTRYVTEQEFRFTGFMRLIGWFSAGSFKKETLKYMTRFKEFAESVKEPA